MVCTVRNIDINYEIYGEGIPVLMIHGWSVDHRLMKGCMEPGHALQIEQDVLFSETVKEWLSRVAAEMDMDPS